jgi:opacity protein-like surface antigen
MRMDFDEKWFGTLYLDGGGSGDEQTRQAGLGLGYRIDDRWSVLGGWRYLEFERENGGQKLDFDMSGVILGASYRF